MRDFAHQCLLGYFLGFTITYSQDGTTDIKQNTSKDAVLRKDVPFGGRKTKI